MRTISRLAILVGLLLTACAVHRYSAPRPHPGDIVRISSGDLHLHNARATLLTLDAHTLCVALADRQTSFPLSRIDLLEVKAGTHSHAGKGALIGMGVGFVAITVASLAQTSESSPLAPSSDAMAVAAVTVLAIPTGVLLGALVGAFIPSEDWQIVYSRGGSVSPEEQSDSP
jgi:hypothetical protein